MPLISLSKKKNPQCKLSVWHENCASSCRNSLLNWIQTSNQFKSASFVNKSDLPMEMPRSGYLVNETVFILETPSSPSKERYWATPDASGSNDGETLKSWCDRRDRVRNKLHNGNGLGMPLAIMVKAFEQPPTPQEKSNLATLADGPIGLKVNPDWVEWLMGFPLGWSKATVIKYGVENRMEYGDKLNAISLFSGIGGFELGLHDYCRTLLYCEADKHAQAVLLSRMSEGAIDNAPICTDVREIDGEFVDIPIDIIFGGFPCQDISCAGKGVGLEGERSGLFFEIVRLAGEIKPTFLFLENVSAIRTRGLDRVILELTEVGYDLRWCMLSASDVGAPHRRERWFLLAARRDALANPESLSDRGELRYISNEDAEIRQSEEQHQEGSASASELSTVLANTESGQSREQTERQGWENPRGRSEDSRRLEGERINEGTEHLANTDNKRLEGSETSRDIKSGPKLANANIEGYEAGLQSRATSQECTNRWREEGSPRPTESNMGRMADGISPDVVEVRKAYLDPSYWKEEPEGIPRVTEEREQRVDRIKRLGNAVVPLQVRTAFEYLMGIYKENNPNLIMPMPLVIPKPKPVVDYEEVEW